MTETTPLCAVSKWRFSTHIDRDAIGGAVRRFEIRMTFKELPASLAESRKSHPFAARKVWRVVKVIEPESFETC